MKGFANILLLAIVGQLSGRPLRDEFTLIDTGLPLRTLRLYLASNSNQMLLPAYPDISFVVLAAQR